MYKAKIYIIVFLLLIITLSVEAHSIDLNFGDLQITPYRQYTKIGLIGFHYFAGKGIPMLPYKDTLIFIGNNINKRIGYEVIDSMVYYNIYITPAQQAYPTDNSSKAKFTIDSAAYGSNKPFPKGIIKVCGFGKERGETYAKVLLSPFKYFPVAKKLIYYDKIRLIVPNIKYVKTQEKYPGMMVITDASYVDHFDEYKKLKTIEGYTPFVRSVQFIYSSYGGIDNAEKIRNYLRTLKDSGIQYIVIGGDVSIVPTRYAYAMASGEGWWYDSIPTDYYYGDIDGSWNANNNSVYGEIGDSVDMLPDFYIGRISFNIASELDTILSKMFNYEKGNYLKSNCSVLSNAGFLDDCTDASIGLDSILTVFPDYFKKSRLYDGNGNQVSLTDFIDSLNSGFNYLIHSNHGNSYGFSIGQDFFYYDNADTLHNLQNSPTLLYTTSCISASYDTDCMAEHYLRAQNGGGYYIGNARFGWYIGYYSGESSTDRMQYLFFRNLFDGGEHTVGELVSKDREAFAPSASVENTYRWMEYNLVLMGDPSTYLRTDTLKNLEVGYGSSIRNSGEIQFNISDGVGPVKNAIVSLFSGDSLITRGKSDLSGNVDLAIPNTNGTTDIYVYKNNYHLFKDTLVIVNKLKYVTSFIKDGNDNKLNPGEVDTLNVIVANLSDSTIYYPMFVLNSYNSFIDVIDTTGSVDSICSGEGDTIPFILDVSDFTDSISLFYFKINGNFLEDSILYKISSGEIELPKREVNISGFPSMLSIKVLNAGDGYIDNKILHIVPINPDINVTPDTVLLSNMYPGDSSFLTLSVDTNFFVPSNIIREILVGNDTLVLLYSWQYFRENVDSISPFGWEMFGMAHVSSRRYYSPPYSFRFGTGNDSLGYYANDSLISPWVKSTGRMILKYRTWYDLQPGWDFGLIFVGKPGDWSFIDSYSGVSNSWFVKNNILNKYAPGDSFKIKFVASTYNDTGYEGWYIDNIELLPDDGASGIKVVSDRKRIKTFKLINNISNNSIDCFIPDDFSRKKLSIIDISGRKVHPKINKLLGNRLKIDIKTLRMGLYIVKYGEYINKIIKI